MTAFCNDAKEIPCHKVAAKVLQGWLPHIYPVISPFLSIQDGFDGKANPLGLMDFTPIFYRLPFALRPIPSTPHNALLNGTFPTPQNGDISDERAVIFGLNTNKRTPPYFDWGNEFQIAWCLESKLSGVDWPICGAFLLINLLGIDLHFHDLPWFGTTGFSCIEDTTGQAWNKTCCDLCHILSSSYWSCAWILQEVVLAQNPRIYFGNHVLPYKRLAEARRNFEKHFTTCCKGVVSSNQISTCEPLNWWMRLHDAFSTCVDKTSEMWLERQDRVSNSHDTNLQSTDIIMSHFKHRQATEPRDIIFSMLGVVNNEGAEAIPVDYSAPVEEVFSRAVAKGMKERQDIDASGICRLRPVREPQGPMTDMTIKFDAFPGVTHDLNLQGDFCLSIVSVKIDTVARVSSAGKCCDHKEWDDIMQNIHQWWECAVLPKDTQDLKMSDAEKSFWTAILGGCLPPVGSALHVFPELYHRISDSDLDIIPQWQAWLQDPSRVSDLPLLGRELTQTQGVDAEWHAKAENFLSFNRRLHYAMMNRRFFATEKGRFGSGLGSEDVAHFTRVEDGDEGHLVAGSCVPVILRPVERPKEGGAKYGNDPAAFSADLKTCVHDQGMVYQLVGPCDVDGVMDGEATKEVGFFPMTVYLR
ncbi:hypothetical protein OQA88_4434 [Cercophora sp. LCS_1]